MNVFTYNQFNGSPDVNSIGLPPNFDGASLPTSIPMAPSGQMSSDNEALVRINGAQVAPEVGITELYTRAPNQSGAAGQPFVPAPQVKTPSLWKTIGQAIIGGNLKIGQQSSTAALVSGTGNLPQQVVSGSHSVVGITPQPSGSTTA